MLKFFFISSYGNISMYGMAFWLWLSIYLWSCLFVPVFALVSRMWVNISLKFVMRRDLTLYALFSSSLKEARFIWLYACLLLRMWVSMRLYVCMTTRTDSCYYCFWRACWIDLFRSVIFTSHRFFFFFLRLHLTFETLYY